MKRRREVAAAPVRAAGECWAVIDALISDSLTRSSQIAREDVAQAMAAAGGAGRMLVSAGHLDREPIVVVAGALHLSITTVSGDEAFAVEENLNAVPGVGSAVDWTVHLPAAEPLTAAVCSAAASSPHLSADPAPDQVDAEASARIRPGPLLDVAAFNRRGSA